MFWVNQCLFFFPCMDGGWGMYLRICVLAVSYSDIPIASGVARSQRQGRRESAPQFLNIHQFVRLEPMQCNNFIKGASSELPKAAIVCNFLW